MLEHLHSQIDFSGCWLDMNEISNLCDGPCSSPAGPTVIDYTHDIPYHPGGKNIEMVNIPLNASHHGQRLEAFTHVFFGLMESYSTYEYLKGKGRRPFILSRSHTLGSSRYAAHWTGDNKSNFTFLKLSIGGTFMQNMLGMQMVGSDICGFGGNATEELCARFFQLGSLYPFARNHNEFDAIDQEPYALGPVVLEAAKKNLKLRYSLLKTYYREFLIRRGVGTIFRPLFFEFYNDSNLFQQEIMESQLLIGRVLMSAPIVEQGQTSRTVFFPGEGWFDLHTGEEYKGGSLSKIEVELTDAVPLFVRKGYLVFLQDSTNVTKTDQLGSTFQLWAGCNLVSSNATTWEYRAIGGLLALGDYDNSNDVDRCLAEECDYRITVTLLISKSTDSKQLTL
jgi:alpha-glucosidase (family GH31 glycosyl hydrolase)